MNNPIVHSLVSAGAFLFLAMGPWSIQGIAQSGSLEPYRPHKQKDYVVTIQTSEGDIALLLYDSTPLHKANFLALAESGYYDSTYFHRVIRGFMIQGGDPESKPSGNPSNIGNGGPGYTIPAEFRSDLLHVKGALASARQPDQINPGKKSSGSQFYIVHNPASCRHLNMNYTVFGQVISGMEVVDAIATSPVRNTRPLDHIYISMKVKRMKKKKIGKLYSVETLDKQ